MRRKFLLSWFLMLLLITGNSSILNADEGNVAKVGNTEYATIDEAIAAWTNNTTLTLLDDVTLSDVVTIKSTEHHILNLGTYTMTAASGKNAFVIQACGTGSAERSAITIDADATNPGGINAGSKCVIYYKYADGGISTEDRPIIKINGGVFTGSTSSWGTAGIYTIGTAARKCATVNIAGGTFDCSIVGSGKSKLIVSGGLFNYTVSSQGDSTCSRLISGGTFKTLGFMTADDNNTKFWIGTSMGNSNVGMYVDNKGYLVVGGPVVDEPNTDTNAGIVHEASTANYGGWSNYLQYSSAKDNGLYYTSVEEALADNNKTSGSVTVYVDELDMTGISYKGTIVVPEGNDITITNVPEDCTVKFSDGTVLTPDESGNVYTKIEVATLEELKNALAGTSNLPIIIKETIVIPEGAEEVLDLNGKTVKVVESTGNHIYALNNKGNLTIKDTKSNGSITARGIYNGYNGEDTDQTVEGAKMTIESGKFVGMDTNGGAAIFNCAELIIEDGDFTGGVCSVNNRKMGVATIKGGEYHGAATSSYQIQNNGGQLTIKDATVDSGFGAVGCYSGTTTIEDGTYSPTGRPEATCHVVYVAGGATVDIQGGTFKMNYPDDGMPDSGSAVASYYNGTLTISGGSFTSHFDNVSPVELSEGSEISGGKYYKHSGEASNHAYIKNFLAPGVTLLENGEVVKLFEGEGTATSPYLIASVEKLVALRDDVNAGETYDGVYFKLESDIALTDAWTAIGNGSRSSKTYNGNSFKGVFDGNNKTISGLTITSTSGADAAVGLFGVVDGGTVKDLNLKDVNINVASSNLAGAAIGMMLNGATADNITVSGAIVGNDGVGGIVGRLIIDGTISNCINNASVTSEYGGIGGIVGKAYYEDGANTSTFASVTECTNNGTITAPKYVGGIVGLARANVTECVNNGAVVGGTQTGGIIGQLIAAGTVSANENTAIISGTNHLGGIIGDYTQSNAYTYYNVLIANNVNRGELAATEQCAAIMGCNNIDGFTAMTATGNVSYYWHEGLELFGNPEDMVIDNTNRFGTEFTVSTQTELQAVLDNCRPGTTILLNPAEYGVVYMRPNPANAATKEVDWQGNNYRYETYSCFENLTIKGVNNTRSAEAAVIDAIVIEGGTYYNTEHSQATQYPVMLSLIELKNVVIEDVTFTGKGGYDPQGYGNVINLSGNNIKANGLTVKNCVFNNAENNARLMYKTESTTTEHNYTYNGESFTFVPSLNDITVEGCTFNGGYMGLELRETENLVISGNTFNNVTSRDILLPTNSGCTYTGEVGIINNKSNGAGNRFLRASGIGNATLTVTGNEIVNYQGEDADFIKADGIAEGNTPVIENNTLEGEDVAVVLNNGTVMVVLPVAQIGTTKYGTLQAAIDAVQNNETITLLSDVTENVTVTQKADVKFTIDGVKQSRAADDNYTFTGYIIVDGKSSAYTTAGVTIKNLNFDAKGIATDASINLGDKGNINNTRYTSNVTVENCTFTGENQAKAAVKSYTGGDKNLTITNCTVDATMHSLAQLINVDGVVIDNCTVNSENGINLNSSANVVVENSKFEVGGYPVRIGVNEGTSGKVELTNNTLKTDNSEGDAAIVIRGTASTQVELTMTKNIVSGTTHISGTTEATNITADANYWDGQSAPVVAEGSTPVEVDTYYTALNEDGTIDEDSLKETPKGDKPIAYVKEVDGYVRVWGETWGNAKESYALELYSGETKIATTVLNNVGGIINGSVNVTWNFFYPESTDEYWTTTWHENPQADKQPDKVVLVIDGVAVNEGPVYMSGADGINPVVWADLGGVISGGTWGGIDWTLVDGTLTITPTTGTPELNPNINDGTTRYAVGAWREAVIYNNGEAEAIGGYPYDRSKVKTLIIKEGVISIGSFTAQSFTNLTGEVVIPYTVNYIGQEAFQKSTMTTLTFAPAPEGYDKELCIAQGAFKNLIIEEVSLPADRPVHLHAWVFNNCHNLKNVTIPATVVSFHGTNHIDYFDDFNQHSNPTWTHSSEIFAYNENMETVEFGSEEVMNQFYSYNNGTVNDYLKANVGLVTYCDVDDAIDAAKSGGTITLVKNTNAGGDNKLNIPADANITIDLKGKNMTCSILAPNANLTVKNGTITNKDASVSAIEINKGTLTIENVNVNSARHALRIDGEVTATINGGTYKAAQGSGTGTYHAANISGAANVTIEDGTFVGPKGTTADSGSAVNVQSGAKVTIEGGDFSGGKNATLGVSGTMIVKGGTFDQVVNALYLADGYVCQMNADNKYEVFFAVAKIGDTYYATLQEALNAAAAGTGNITVEILDDINLTNVDWNPVTVSAPGYPVVTVEGNNKTITGLNDMLFAGTWAGNSGLIINDLTIANSNIVNDKDDTQGTVGVGAFIGYPQASATITLNNCQLKASHVEGGHWTGGLIGMAGGYNGNDGPVFMNLTIKDCSVTGSTITGKGSCGGIIGHGSCAAWTAVNIQNTTVSDNYVISNGSSTNKAGAVMGTIGAAGQPTTANGVTMTGGAMVAAIVSDNTVTSGGTAITTIYGRQGTDTGILELNGGSYDNYPIEQNVAYAKPAAGLMIKENADGTYGLVEDPAYGKVAMIGETYYETLSAAFAAVTDDEQTVVILSDVTEKLEANLRGNITTKDGTKVTITLTNEDWVYCPYTFILGENITLNVPALFYYAGGAQINGTVVADAYYQRYANTKLTINEPGSMKVTTETFIVRYMDADPNAGIYIIGDNNDETIGLDASVIYFYQGMINAKDADIKVGTYWQTNEADNQGSANLVLDNSNMTVTVNEHNMKATANSTVTLTNGSNVTVAGGYQGVGVSIDATSSMTMARSIFVSKINNYHYTSLQEAVNVGGEVTVLQDITLTETVTIEADKTVTLDLAGCTVKQEKAQTEGYAMITNVGTLTIKDSSNPSTGKLSYKDTGDGGNGSFASNTIQNHGHLTILGGRIENLSEGQVVEVGYPHAIDHGNYSKEYTVGDVTLDIQGGTISNAHYSAIRMFCNSTIYRCDATISGGTIENAIDFQLPNAGKLLGSLTITGGTFNNINGKTTSVRMFAAGNANDGTGMIASIEGGTFNGTVGVITQLPVPGSFNTKVIKGGTFDQDPSAYLAPGYVAVKNGNVWTVGLGVAKLNGVTYVSLQAAIDAAVAGDNAIQLLANIDGDVRVSQQEGVNITINGKISDTENYQFNGTVFVDGNSRSTGTETLTIQDINFYTADDSRDFISCNDGGNAVIRYAHNVTVRNCNFTATETSNAVLAMRFRQTYNIRVEGGNFKNLHSVMWATGVTGITVNGIVAENCKEGGLSLGTSTDLKVENVDIEGKLYGIRLGGNNNSTEILGGTLTVTGSKIEAKTPVLARNANSATTFTFNGTNVMTEENDANDYWCIICDGGYNGEETPTYPLGQVTVVLNDAGLSYDGVYGNYGVAKIGDVVYTTFNDAYNAAAENNNVITLLADAVVEQTVAKPITINGNEKQLAGNMLVTSDVTFGGKLGLTNNVKVTNGATLTIAEGAEVTGAGTFFGAGSDNNYYGMTNSVTAAGTIKINGNVDIQQINANNAGVVTVAEGAKLTVDIVCAENGDMQNAVAGVMNISGNVETQRFNIFGGSTVNVNATGVVSSEQEFTSSNIVDVISIWGGAKLVVNGTVTCATIEHTDARYSKVNIGADGTLVVDKGGIFTCGGELKNAGELKVVLDCTAEVQSLTGNGKVTVDATYMTASEGLAVKADVTNFNGEITVVGGSYEKTSEGIYVRRTTEFFYTAAGVETTQDQAAYSLMFTITDNANKEVSVKIGSMKPANNSKAVLVIPATVAFDGVNEAFKVTAIEDDAFNSCRNFVGDLTLPQYVRTIGDRSFNTCHYITNPEHPKGKLTLNEGLISIGTQAFTNSYFTDGLSIPSSVTMIEPNAFQYAKINGALTINSDVECALAFNSSEFTKVEIAEGVEEICANAFNGMVNVTEVVLPSTLKEIGLAAFGSDNAIETIWSNAAVAPTIIWQSNIESNKHPFTQTVRNNAVVLVTTNYKNYTEAEKWKEFANIYGLYPIQKTGYSLLVKVNDNVCSVEIGDKPHQNDRIELELPRTIEYYGTERAVTSIAKGGFRSCPFFGILTIPGNIETIADNAFNTCMQFDGLVIEEGVKTIGNGSFSMCYGVDYISFPSTLESIGQNAFNVVYMENGGRIVSFAANPPTAYKHIYNQGINPVNPSFPQNLRNNAILYVFEESLDKYKSATGWEFRDVRPIEAKIGETYYLTLNEAIAAATSGQTITLLANVEAADGNPVLIPEGVTLDINTHNVTANIYGTVKTSGGLWTTVTVPGFNSRIMLGNGAIYNTTNATVANSANEVKMLAGSIVLNPNPETEWWTLPNQNLSIASGASFEVPANIKFTVRENTHVVVNGTLTVNGVVYLQMDATVEAAAGLNILTDVEGYMVSYEDGVYSVVQAIFTQTTQLGNGWNWFSYYVETDFNALKSALGENGSYMKEHHSGEFAQYYPSANYWYGEMTLTPTRMYYIETSSSHELNLQGLMVDTKDHEITIKPNWNAIGYYLGEEQSLNDALKSLKLNNGDYIKSKTVYATYYEGYGWYGELQKMIPGEGYFFQSASTSDRILKYSYLPSGSKSELRDNVSTDNNHWIPNAGQYANNMTMTSMVNVEGNYEIAAFVNGEVRGSARPIYVEALDSYIYFLTIHGDEVEEMSFRLYDLDTDVEYNLSDRMNYSNDAIVGSLTEPYMFNLEMLGIGENSAESFNIYPNPTTTNAEINLNATCDKVEVFNALGVKIAEYSNVDSIDAVETAGIYVIKVTNNNNVQHCRLIVK